MTPPGATDAIIYEPEAIRIGVLLFGTRICCSCAAVLPACTDYYAPDTTVPSGLTTNCRRCRRSVSRASHARRRAKKAQP